MPLDAHGFECLATELADSITGTAGPDAIKANGGNDAISVRGGARDRVQCGTGNDKVKADRADRIDKSSCERILRSGGGKAHKK